MNFNSVILSGVVCADLLCGCVTDIKPDAVITLATYNIRCPRDESPNTREERKDRCRAVIRKNGLDISGVQEAFRHQLDDLLANSDYAFIGKGRDDFKDKGEFAAIIYNKNRFEVIDSGVLSLSETPDVPGVVAWNAVCPRMAAIRCLPHRCKFAQ